MTGIDTAALRALAESADIGERMSVVQSVPALCDEVDRLRLGQEPRKEHTMTREVSREDVAGWEEALGCERDERPARYPLIGRHMCLIHGYRWTALGCPVAVRAAQHAAGLRAADRAALDVTREGIDTAALRAQHADTDRAPRWGDVLALCDEVDRLRLGVDYTDEGAEVVIRQLQELRRERDEARAALAKAWDEGLQRGEDIAARDSAFYTDEWVKNPYRSDE